MRSLLLLFNLASEPWEEPLQKDGCFMTNRQAFTN